MMKFFGIVGHKTRGADVIALLETFGFENVHKYDGKSTDAVYTVDNEKICTTTKNVARIDNRRVYTLEEFEEKFPYKLGDVVLNAPFPGIDIYSEGEIIKMYWTDMGQVAYVTSNAHILLTEDICGLAKDE